MKNLKFSFSIFWHLRDIRLLRHISVTVFLLVSASSAYSQEIFYFRQLTGIISSSFDSENKIQFFSKVRNRKFEVLKTDIKSNKQLNKLKPVFQQNDHVARWSVDLNAIDKVLKSRDKDIYREELPD